MQHITNPWQNSIPGNVSPSSVALNNFNPNAINYGGLPPEVAPTSTAVYANTSTFSWAHTVPSFMPWVTKGDANVQEPIVHFTAPFPPDPCTSQTATSWELLNNFGANKSNVNSHLKRKNDLELLEAAPQKMCVTEERMAARFRQMHISNEYAIPSENTPFGPCSPSIECNALNKTVTNLNQLEFILKGNQDGFSSKSLVLAPELKKLVEPEKIFASTFLDKVERPSLALVPWTPNNNPLIRANENSDDSEGQEHSSANSNSSGICSQIFVNKDGVEPELKTTFEDTMDT